MKKVTPLLSVDDVASSVAFWVDRLGFESSNEVPGEDGLAFAMLEHGDASVMLQSWASIDAAPGPLSRPEEPTPSFLYVEVSDLHEIMTDAEGLSIVIEPHETFYGMREVTLEEPGGHLVTLAQPVPES